MLWQTHWSSLYTSGSLSQLIISEIQNTYYLVNLVDNDYVQGNVLFEVSGHVMSGGSHVTIKSVGGHNYVVDINGILFFTVVMFVQCHVQCIYDCYSCVWILQYTGEHITVALCAMITKSV